MSVGLEFHSPLLTDDKLVGSAEEDLVWPVLSALSTQLTLNGYGLKRKSFSPPTQR